MAGSLIFLDNFRIIKYPSKMISHSDIWAAVDALAVRNGMSPSGLARSSGLDPTTFNKSKRVSRSGKPRWPSTESIAKVLTSTDTTIGSFLSVLSSISDESAPHTLKCLATDGSDCLSMFDEHGMPDGRKWRDVPFPGLRDMTAFMITLGNDDLSPILRTGVSVVVSPEAMIDEGALVAVLLRDGRLIFRILRKRTMTALDMTGPDPESHDRVLELNDVVWIYRIVWAQH